VGTVQEQQIELEFAAADASNLAPADGVYDVHVFVESDVSTPHQAGLTGTMYIAARQCLVMAHAGRAMQLGREEHLRLDLLRRIPQEL
jgi:hypothetical protein